MTNVGSPQQQAIWDAICGEQSYVIVQALAGTGKTYTIVEVLKLLAPELRQYCGFVAFNKSIATELQTRVPEGVQAMTLHSLGFQAIKKAWGHVKIDADRTDRMLPENLDPAIKSVVPKIVSICKGMLVDTSSDDNLWDVCAKYDIDIDPDPTKAQLTFDTVRDIMAKQYGKSNIIDFDDMIWLPVVLSLPVPRFAILFVDEAQDLNRAQQELILRAAKRLVMVGDYHQAIYGFRGADVESMSRMETTLSQTLLGCKVFPLTVTRRCAQTVTKLAQEIVPTFECLPNAPTGTITYESRREPVVGDMVLCRVNAPLIKTAYKLIRANVPVKIQGRDIGAGLASQIKRLVPATASTTELLRKLDVNHNNELAKLQALSGKRVQARIEALMDRYECIVYLCESLDTVAQVLSRIQALFSDIDKKDSKRFVLLSSVHRAKGLEADNVHILKPELMPHPMAKQPWQIEQEMNLKYVAITRAKLNLYMMAS